MRSHVVTLLIGLVALPPASGQEPLAFVRSIDLPGVDGRIDHLAFDPDTQRLFVAALGNNTVEILDLKANAHLKTLTGFHEPQGLAVLTGTKQVAVANGQGEGIQLMDSLDLRLGKVVPLGEDSDNVRYDPSAKRYYVGFGSGALATIPTSANRAAGQVKLAGHPESFQLERSGSRIFVNVPTANQIAVIDRTTMAVTTTWPIVEARSNYPMALDEASHRIFVGCRRPAKAIVYDTSSGKPMTSFDIVGDTDDLFYDAARKRLYVSGGEGFVDVFDAQGMNTLTRIAHIATATGARTSLFVADQSRLYLAVPHRGSQKAAIRVYEAR